jgi:hypothetical protein
LLLIAADFPQPESVMPAKAGVQYAAASRIYRRLVDTGSPAFAGDDSE